MQDLSVWESVFAAAVFVVLAWVIGWRIALALRVVTGRGDSRDEVMQLLERAAKGMAAQSPGQEAEEVAYLLESLGRRVDDSTYRQVLDAVKRDVAARLQAPKPPSPKGEYRTSSPGSALR